MSLDRATEQELLWRCQKLLDKWQEGQLSPDQALSDIEQLTREVREDGTNGTHNPEVQT